MILLAVLYFQTITRRSQEHIFYTNPVCIQATGFPLLTDLLYSLVLIRIEFYRPLNTEFISKHPKIRAPWAITKRHFNSPIY